MTDYNDTEAVRALLALEQAREVRRKRRNRVLLILAALVVVAGLVAIPVQRHRAAEHEAYCQQVGMFLDMTTGYSRADMPESCRK